MDAYRKIHDPISDNIQLSVNMALNREYGNHGMQAVNPYLRTLVIPPANPLHLSIVDKTHA